MKIVKYKNIVYLFFLLQILFIQFSTHNYETLSIDINAFLVTAQEFGRGNMPLEFQYENKPPLLFLIYFLLISITGGSLLQIKILNDLIIWVLSILLVLISESFQGKKTNWVFIPSIIFILFTSNVWFHPGYSEYFSLIFISLSYITLEKTNMPSRFYLSGIFIAVSTLINFGTMIFLVGLLSIALIRYEFNLKKILQILLGFSFIHLITAGVYSLRKTFDEYFMAIYEIPISYTSTEFSFYKSFTIFLESLSKYNLFIYLLFIIGISIFLFVTYLSFSSKIIRSKEIEFTIITLCSFIFYILAAKNYYHHLIYLIYFLPLSFLWMKNIKSKLIILPIITFGLITVNTFFYEASSNNLKNYAELESSYPMKNVTDALLEKDAANENIFSTKNILILYYLDKPNISYIVHPGLYDYSEITSVLIKNSKIKRNELEVSLSLRPDIFEGRNSSYESSSLYSKLEIIDIDLKLIHYWDKDESIDIYILNKSS